jgi:hypothetical protein
LGKVKCGEKEISLCTRYEVNAFPTLKIFRKGEASDYNGGRDRDSGE